MSFEIEGKLYKKFDTENKTDKFQAREFVIQIDNGNYPQLIKFQLVQDRCPVIDTYNEGDVIKVHFDLRGREWNDKYFTNLNAWRVEAVAQAAAPANAPVEATGGDADFPSVADAPAADDIGDDLPF